MLVDITAWSEALQKFMTPQLVKEFPFCLCGTLKFSTVFAGTSPWALFAFSHYLFMIGPHFNIALPFIEFSCGLFWGSHQNHAYFTYLMCTAFQSSHSLWLDYAKSTWWRVHVTKFLIMSNLKRSYLPFLNALTACHSLPGQSQNILYVDMQVVVLPLFPL